MSKLLCIEDLYFIINFEQIKICNQGEEYEISFKQEKINGKIINHFNIKLDKIDRYWMNKETLDKHFMLKSLYREQRINEILND